MGEPNSTVTLISKLDGGDPLYMHPSDSSSQTIVSVKLKGTENYTVWARAMILALQVRNKYGFIMGTIEKSKTDEVLASQWDKCNSTVLTWILNSVCEEIYLGHVFSKLANQVWQDLKETYDKKDGSVIFDMYQKINCLSQNGMSVSDYYNKLTAMWKQFDEMIQLPCCTCAAAREINDLNHMIKLFQFTMGLDTPYHPVRTNLFLRDTLPTVKEAFCIVSREESHRNMSSANKSPNISFATKSTQFSNTKKRTVRNPDLKCSHCDKSGHTIDQCFELIGYPSWMKAKSGQKKRANSSVSTDIEKPSSSGSSSLTAEQVAKLLSLLEMKSEGGQSNNVSGKMLSCVSKNKIESNVMNMYSCNSYNNKLFDFHSINENVTLPGWILDSGANNHMFQTDKGLVSVIDVTEFNIRVKHPNGTFAVVTKIGNMKIAENVIMFDIFVIPEYSVNLISIHKLVKDNKLFVGFDEHKCYIQDLSTKKTLVTGNQLDGLYLYGGFSGASKDSIYCVEWKNSV